MEEDKNPEVHCRKSLDYSEEIGRRNVNTKSPFSEASAGNKEHAIIQWRTGDFCYETANN